MHVYLQSIKKSNLYHGKICIFQTWPADSMTNVTIYHNNTHFEVKVTPIKHIFRFVTIKKIMQSKDETRYSYLLTLPRKSLISRMDWVSCAGDINLPHTPFPPARYPPNKEIKDYKILTYILRSIFLEIPHLELPR